MSLLIERLMRENTSIRIRCCRNGYGDSASLDLHLLHRPTRPHPGDLVSLQ